MTYQLYMVFKGSNMALKRYKITTLIKVAVVSYFSASVFASSRYPEYDNLIRKGWNMIKVGLSGLFLIFVSGVLFGAESIIYQGCFVLYLAMVACACVYSIIQMFKVWHFFFKERLEKEDKEE